MRITERLSRMESAVKARQKAADWERTQAQVDAILQGIINESRRREALGLPVTTPEEDDAMRRLVEEIKASVRGRAGP